MKYHEFLTADAALDLFDTIPELSQPANNAMRFEMPSYAALHGMECLPDLVKLPYSSCWFEGIGVPTSSGCETWGFLLIDRDDAILGYAWVYTRNASDLTWREREWMPTFTFKFDLVDKVWRVPKTQPQLRRDDGTFESVLDTNDQQGKLYACSAFNHLGAFLSLLNCNNVPRINNPAPDQLNKKRARTGKPPLFSYWTLDLSASKEKGAPQDGTHASPRLHLRRGHFRKYAADKTCWVIPCTVGNKKLGMVHKDYAMRHVDEAVH